ncbi:MAG: hypothetical protein IT385_09930 [Deltaproteobacteria bacterium]|nr:hypothetical protein [Deltaproteobacteria bacterium]
MRKQLVVWMSRALVVTGGLAGAACGGGSEFVVRGTEKSVGIDGVIAMTHQQEDVNLVTVDLVNLPPAERHDRNKKYFIVWLTPAEGTVIKAGRLAYDADARRGVLRATIPTDQVFVQVTAESLPDAATPSDFVIVSKHVSIKRAGDEGETGASL